jgi:hypothetical protein
MNAQEADAAGGSREYLCRRGISGPAKCCAFGVSCDSGIIGELRRATTIFEWRARRDEHPMHVHSKGRSDFGYSGFLKK